MQDTKLAFERCYKWICLRSNVSAIEKVTYINLAKYKNQKNNYLANVIDRNK